MSQWNKYKVTREILKAIPRYGRIRSMFYRSNVYLHEQRVLALVNATLPFLHEREPGLNIQRLRTFADLHDDLEMYFEEDRSPDQGDDPKKGKYCHALRVLNIRYNFEIGGINVREWQTLYHLQMASEAKIVKYFDRFD